MGIILPRKKYVSQNEEKSFKGPKTTQKTKIEDNQEKISASKIKKCSNNKNNKNLIQLNAIQFKCFGTAPGNLVFLYAIIHYEQY